MGVGTTVDTQSVTATSLPHAHNRSGASRTRRALARIVLMAGLAVLGWFVAALMSTPAAAASTADSEPTNSGGGLLGAVGGLAGGTVNTVGNTVGTTVGTTTNIVTNTVDTTTNVVTNTVDTVTNTLGNTVDTVTDTTDSLTGGLVRPITESTQPSEPERITPVTDTEPEPTATVRTPVAKKQKSDAPERDSADADKPVAKPEPKPRTASPPTTPATTHTSPGGGHGPAPFAPPTAPCAPGSSAALAHAGADHSGSHRQLLAGLDNGTTTTQLKLIGTQHSHPAFAAGRDAALPCTTPD